MTVGLSTVAGSSWSSVCTPANSPAGWLARTTTAVPVIVSWYPCVPTLAGAPDRRSWIVPDPPETGIGYPVDVRRIVAR